MKLRPYQLECATAGLEALRMGFNPALHLPTGGGKSAVIAHIAHHLVVRQGRVLVLAHVQELLVQNCNTYKRLTGLDNIGIVSAGLNRNERDAAVVFAGIQSIHKQGNAFTDRDLVIVDESHSVPLDGDGIMYNRFIKDTGARVLGLTATPWRLDGGAIHGDGKLFDVLAYQKSPLELVAEGWLSPLVGVESKWQLNMKGVSKTAGDFSQSSVQKQMENDVGWLSSTLAHTVEITKNRKHVVVFAPTVEIAQSIQSMLTDLKQTAATVHADSVDRLELLAAWKAGEIKYMCNVGILTTGFDFPELDAIACFRPTQSSGLWVQMMGRGMRIAQGKTDCLVLDYVGNLSRLGGVSMLEDWNKERPEAKEGGKDDQKKTKTSAKEKIYNFAISNLDPMLDSNAGIKVDVLTCEYIVRPSKTPNISMMMAVYDTVTEEGLRLSATQAVCVEHQSGARWHASQWFKRRGYTKTMPQKAYVAKMVAYGLPTPKTIQLRRNSGYINVLNEQF